MKNINLTREALGHFREDLFLVGTNAKESVKYLTTQKIHKLNVECKYLCECNTSEFSVYKKYM